MNLRSEGESEVRFQAYVEGLASSVTWIGLARCVIIAPG